MKKILSVLLALTIVFATFTFTASAYGCDDDNAKSGWEQMVLDNYNEFISEVDGDENKIPMIISTDQHGGVTLFNKTFEYVNEIVDWNKVSKIINLGDTVTLFFNPFELLAYRYATKSIPTEKRIELCGNHDSHVLPVKLLSGLFFPTPGAVKAQSNNAFVVKDDAFNVRYLSIDPMSFPWKYEGGKITSKQADFIVSELSKQDSSDIVLLAHPYLFRDEITRRDGSVFTGSDYFIGGSKKYADVKQSFLDMLLARKNKTAGVFIDCDGVKHPYDFSSCEGDFLMSLHGHHHSEGYETSNGITEFLFQGFSRNNEDKNEPNCFYFAYIDRSAKTFKCWKNVKGYDAWEIPIA